MRVGGMSMWQLIWPWSDVLYEARPREMLLGWRMPAALWVSASLKNWAAKVFFFLTHPYRDIRGTLIGQAL